MHVNLPKHSDAGEMRDLEEGGRIQDFQNYLRNVYLGKAAD